MATAQEELDRLRGLQRSEGLPDVAQLPDQTIYSELDRLRSIDFSQPPPDLGIMGEKPRDISSASEGLQALNKGIIAPFMLPLDAIDYANTSLGESTAERLGAPESLGNRARAALANTGMTPDPRDEPEGIIPDALEIFGGSLVFSAGMYKYGQAVSKSLPASQRNWLQKSLAEVAEDTGSITIKGKTLNLPAGIARSTAMDLSSSVGASIGTKVASELELEQTGTVLTQMLGGFIHPMSIVNMALSGSSASRIRDSIIPGGAAKNRRRAARQIQAAYADPEIAAKQIDISSGTPAARQLGSEAGLQLEQRVLNTDPLLRQQYTADLNSAIDDAIAEGAKLGNQRLAGRELKGQSTRAIRYSKEQADQHIRLMNLRSAQAAQEAEITISRLGADATPDDISRIVKEKVQEAYKVGRDLENAAYEAVDNSWVVQPNSTQRAVRKEVNKISNRFGDSSVIPDSVRKLTGKVRDPITLLDMRSVKTDVGDMYDAARAAGRKNEARILNNIQKAIRKDIDNSGAPGIENAIRVSREFNKKFTQGGVGKLLAVEKGGVERITGREALPTITGRKAAAESIRQMIKGDPSIEGDVRNFVTSSYYTSVLTNAGGKPGRINQLHNQFIRRMKKQGVLETFPDLEDQLNATRQSVLKDANIRAQLKDANKRGGLRMKYNRKKMLANEYMGGNGDIILDGLLTSKNPLDEARNAVRIMEGNEGAKQGLKAAFVESLYKRATNSAGDIDSKKLSALISNNAETAKALGFTPPEMTRMNRIRESVTAANRKPDVAGKGAIVQDATGFVLDVLARWGAVTAAGVVPTKGAGASLQMANLFSGKMKQVLRSVGQDGAAELIKAAHTDNKLYRALLVSPSSSAARQRVAAKHIQAWLPSLALKDDKEFQDTGIQ